MNVKDKVRLYANQGLVLENPVAESVFVTESVKPTGNEKEHIMNIVFAKDEMTGKPMNDLTFTQNVNLPDNVREFIKKQLQSPFVPEKGSPDADLATDLIRGTHETAFEYSRRLSKIAYDGEQSIKASAATLKKSKSLKK